MENDALSIIYTSNRRNVANANVWIFSKSIKQEQHSNIQVIARFNEITVKNSAIVGSVRYDVDLYMTSTN